MDRILSKSLERIRRLSDKGQIEKALQLLDDQLKINSNMLFLYQEEIRLGLLLPNWSELLRRLKQSLTRFRLRDLLKNENRLKFADLFRETPAFRGALMDHLLNNQAFNQIADLVRLSETGDQAWMATRWVQLGQDINEKQLASNWHIAAGIANFVKGDWDEAWSLWSQALKTDARSLKKIMNICQESGQMEMTQLNHRLRIIRLIEAAGKREEAVSLLHALGMESKENALQVLIEIPHLLGEDLNTLDVSRLRFNLAVFLQDGEIISSIIDHMDSFSDDDLFAFQKQATVNLEDKDFKRTVLLKIAQVYMKKGSWEAAAQLLEGLHEEDDHPEIVAKMEEVLEENPILPRMHLLVAKYQIRNRMTDAAINHLMLIKEVGEFQDVIVTTLLDELHERFDNKYAQFLLQILPHDSDQSALVAWAILHFSPDLSEDDVQKIIRLAPKKQHSPFWLLTLAKAYMRLHRPQKAVDVVAVFLRKFPDLSPEILKLTETLIDIPGIELNRLLKVLDQLEGQLTPHDLWILLPRQIQFRITTASDRNAATKQKGHVSVAEEPMTPTETPPPSDEGVSAGRSKDIDEVLRLADSGEYRAAAQLVERLAEQDRERIPSIMGLLDELGRQHGQALIWEKSRMHILVRSEAYHEAIALGEGLLDQDSQAKDQPALHQLMAFAHDGLGQKKRALEYLCKSSQDARYYQRNRRQFYRLLFPDHTDLLPEVLELVITHGDADTWAVLLDAWCQDAPDSREEQLKWYVRFADRVADSGTYLDLAYRAVQANRLAEAHGAIAKIDFKEPNLADQLVRVVDLIKLKLPKDISAPFSLGRYYLIQKEIPKAVEAFRSLAAEIPETTKKIYSYVRKFVDIHPEQQNDVKLCGLLIRLALDLRLYVDAVDHLERLGKDDIHGAKSLSGGVLRVVSQRKNSREGVVAFLSLLNSWGDHQRVLDVLDTVDLGRQLTEKRLQWLHQACQIPELADRAKLAMARLYFDIQEFDKCYETLKSAGDEIKGEALSLYQSLIKRLPKETRLHREAGWVFWRCGLGQEAVEQLRQVIDQGSGEFVVEAFALLRELGEHVEFKDILKTCDMSENDALAAVQACYEKIRQAEIDRWLQEGGAIPLESLKWLLHSGRLEAFDAHYAKMKTSLPAEEQSVLEAFKKHREGQTYYAALHVLDASAPTGVKRFLLASAGLIEQAVLLKDPDREAIPYWLKQRFLKTHGKRRIIMAQHAGMRRGNASEQSRSS